MEQRIVAEVLVHKPGNVTRAAELFGLTRDTLRYRIEKYHINSSLKVCLPQNRKCCGYIFFTHFYDHFRY